VYTNASGDTGDGASSSRSVRGVIDTRQEFALALFCAEKEHCARMDSEKVVLHLEMDGGRRSEYIHFDPESVVCDEHNLDRDCFVVLDFSHENNHTVVFNATMLGRYHS
jgi:hypothetical protein